jgi:hypothetical protein
MSSSAPSSKQKSAKRKLGGVIGLFRLGEQWTLKHKYDEIQVEGWRVVVETRLSLSSEV